MKRAFRQARERARRILDSRGDARGGERGGLGQAGQSTVEFALTLFLLMAFLLFYVQLSLLMGFGNYVHYATFMAARAYLSAGSDQGDQVARAQSVMVRMVKRGGDQGGLDRFPEIAKGTGAGDPTGVQIQAPDQFDATKVNFSWLQGVRYSFKGRLFVIPFGGTGAVPASASGVSLQSESWLGREPTTQECKGEMQKRGEGIFDNGC